MSRVSSSNIVSKGKNGSSMISREKAAELIEKMTALRVNYAKVEKELLYLRQVNALYFEELESRKNNSKKAELLSCYDFFCKLSKSSSLSLSERTILEEKLKILELFL